MFVGGFGARIACKHFHRESEEILGSRLQRLQEQREQRTKRRKSDLAALKGEILGRVKAEIASLSAEMVFKGPTRLSLRLSKADKYRNQPCSLSLHSFSKRAEREQHIGQTLSALTSSCISLLCLHLLMAASLSQFGPPFFIMPPFHGEFHASKSGTR